MKKIVLMMLVAMVPFLAMAQKKAKKKKKVQTEINEGLASYEFMVITGYELAISQQEKIIGNSSAASKNNVIRTFSKVLVNFDFGRVKGNQASNLLENSRNYKTMAASVNAAAKEGWNFVSSDVVSDGKNRIHYYYMKRNK